MSWQAYATGTLALAGLELLLSSASSNGGASKLGSLVGTTIPNILNRIISPTVPFFTPTASSSSSGTSLAAATTPAPAATPQTPAVLKPITVPSPGALF